MVRIAGLNGIWVTFPLAEIAAAVVGGLLYRKVLRHLPGQNA